MVMYHGAVLVMIAYFYFTIVMPFILNAGDLLGSPQDLQAYALFMFLVFCMGLVFIRLAILYGLRF